MADQRTGLLLDQFIGAVRPVVPVISAWAHGSLAAGDYQPGRSDLDLIAVLGRSCTAAEEQQLRHVHERPGNAIPLAAKLHAAIRWPRSWMIPHARI
jgi:predicted nucleotidyltransferase